MPYLWITNSSSNEKIKHSSQNPPPPQGTKLLCQGQCTMCTMGSGENRGLLYPLFFSISCSS